MQENNTEEKRTYTQVVTSMETHLIYINSHLKNIDSHLDKLNDRTKDNEIKATKNKTNIAWVIRIGGTLFGGGGVTALMLWAVGVI